MIAWGISVVITKAISVVFIVTITQSIKIAVKKTIKVITYKKGADKMNKFKQFFVKLGVWFKANPLTIGASVTNLVSSSGFGATIYAIFTYFNVAIPDWAMYLIVAVSSVLVACLAEWGIVKNGWETCEQKEARLKAEAEAKEAKRIEEEAKKALAAEEAEAAKIEADAKATLEAEEKAKADAEKAAAEARAEAEYKARVQAKIEEMRNAK